MNLLEIKGLTKFFGGLAAVKNVDIDVKPGEIVGLIGPNGAGKTTIFNLITSVYPVSSGKIFFKGEDITSCRSSTVARKGIARTFQLATLFDNKTIFKNMVMAFYLEANFSLKNAILNTVSTQEREENIVRRARELIDFLGLGGIEDRMVKSLPHGHRKCLGVGMALATSPELLLLDEPVGGMNLGEVSSMIELIRTIRERGITILLVEHNLRAIMDLCDRIVVLNFGQKIAEGVPTEIREDEEVIGAYLGTGFRATQH